MSDARNAPRVDALDHLVLTVADIGRTTAFYVRVLGLRAEVFVAADGSQRHALSLGRQKINLHAAARPFEPRARRATPGSADLCLLSETPLADWQAHLARAGAAVELGPVPRTGATGPIVSIYLRDPDGNLLEIANPA